MGWPTGSFQPMYRILCFSLSCWWASSCLVRISVHASALVEVCVRASVGEMRIKLSALSLSVPPCFDMREPGNEGVWLCSRQLWRFIINVSRAKVLVRPSFAWPRYSVRPLVLGRVEWCLCQVHRFVVWLLSSCRMRNICVSPPF